MPLATASFYNSIVSVDTKLGVQGKDMYTPNLLSYPTNSNAK